MLAAHPDLNTVPPGKRDRVRRMRERLQAALRGEAVSEELFDPLLGEGTDDEGWGRPSALGAFALGLAITASLAMAGVLIRRRRQTA